jgi:hypothetical protein
MFLNNSMCSVFEKYSILLLWCALLPRHVFVFWIGWRASFLLYSVCGEYLFFIPCEAITAFPISHHESTNYLSTLKTLFSGTDIWKAKNTAIHKHPRYYNWRAVAVPMTAGHLDCVSVYWNVCLVHFFRTILTLLTSSGQWCLAHFLRTRLALLTSSGQCWPYSTSYNAYLTHFLRTMLALLTSSGQCWPYSLPPVKVGLTNFLRTFYCSCVRNRSLGWTSDSGLPRPVALRLRRMIYVHCTWGHLEGSEV